MADRKVINTLYNGKVYLDDVVDVSIDTDFEDDSITGFFIEVDDDRYEVTEKIYDKVKEYLNK